MQQMRKKCFCDAFRGKQLSMIAVVFQVFVYIRSSLSFFLLN